MTLLLALLALVACSRPDAPPADTPPPCKPVAAVDAPWHLEGAVVTATVACADGQKAGRRVDVRGLPDGATFDDTTWTLSWTTGLDDAGVYDVDFVVTSTGGLAEGAAATIAVVDAWDEPGNVPIDPSRYPSEYGLPVVDVDVDVLSEDAAPATIWWKGEAHAGTAQIRGATSSWYPKPGLTLEVDDRLDLTDEGLGENDHLLLVTTFDDDSYVRQKLSYDLWAAISEGADPPRLTPRSAFVVVYVNGEYYGLLVAVDRFDDDFVAAMGFEPGGEIYKAITHDANWYSWNAYGGGKSTWHDGYTAERGTSDWSPLDAAVEFAATSDDATFEAGADEYIVPDEFVDWLTFVELASADDSGAKNCYLYHDPSTGLLRYSPWDFNHSFGQDWETLRIPSDAWDDFTWANGVFAHDEAAIPDQLDARWREVVAGPFSADALRARLDGYYAAIDPEARRDWAKWGDDYRSYGGWAAYRDAADDWTDYDGEKAYLYEWVDERAKWAGER